MQTGIQEDPIFTADDHLRAQQQIEVRANEYWRAGGCRDEAALSDWLRAECEVLEQFVLTHILRPPARREPRQRSIADRKRLNRKTQLLRQPISNKSQKHLIATLPL